MTETLRIDRDNAIHALDRLAARMQTERAAGRLSEDEEADIARMLNGRLLKILKRE